MRKRHLTICPVRGWRTFFQPVLGPPASRHVVSGLAYARLHEIASSRPGQPFALVDSDGAIHGVYEYERPPIALSFNPN
jgi:hypothetical protein